MTIESREIKYYFLFILIGAFPITPFKMKGLAVCAFVVLALIVIPKKFKKLNLFYFLNSLLYLSYVMSLIYSDSFSRGLSVLETTVSMFVFPLVFFFISGNKNASKHLIKHDRLLKVIFVGSSFLLSALIFITSLEFGNYFTEKIDINKFLIRLNTDFYWMEDHPIYLSIYIATTILMIGGLILKTKSYQKLIFLIIGAFQLFVLLVLSKKGVIISLIIALALFCFFTIRKKMLLILYIILGLAIFSFLTKNYAPDTIKRFREVVDVKSYKKIESHSSTSQRYGIYKCSLETFNEKWLLGFGVGDTQNALTSCYTKSSEVLVKGQYNSHNQYLGILLNVGIIGFLFFIITMFINLKLFYTKKDFLAFCLILMYLLFMLTENILDRQNGVILFSFFLNYYFFKNTHLN